MGPWLKVHWVDNLPLVPWSRLQPFTVRCFVINEPKYMGTVDLSERIKGFHGRGLFWNDLLIWPVCDCCLVGGGDRVVAGVGWPQSVYVAQDRVSFSITLTMWTNCSSVATAHHQTRRTVVHRDLRTVRGCRALISYYTYLRYSRNDAEMWILSLMLHIASRRPIWTG